MKNFIRIIARKEILRREKELQEIEREKIETQRKTKLEEESRKEARLYYKQFLEKGFITFYNFSHTEEKGNLIKKEFNYLLAKDLNEKLIRRDYVCFGTEERITISEGLKNDLQKLSHHFIFAQKITQ